MILRNKNDSRLISFLVCSIKSKCRFSILLVLDIIIPVVAYCCLYVLKQIVSTGPMGAGTTLMVTPIVRK